SRRDHQPGGLTTWPTPCSGEPPLAKHHPVDQQEAASGRFRRLTVLTELRHPSAIREHLPVQPIANLRDVLPLHVYLDVILEIGQLLQGEQEVVDGPVDRINYAPSHDRSL